MRRLFYCFVFLIALPFVVNSQTVCADLDGDNYVSTNDLLEFLSQFGTYCVVSSACNNETSVNYHGVDYALVSIGDQCWFSENLRTSAYLNGDQIIYAPNDLDWTTNGSNQNGAYAIYDNNLSLEYEYGYLYNNYAITDLRFLCPNGYKVPSDYDFIELEHHLGISISDAHEISIYRGIDEGEKLKSESLWNGTNESGFSAISSGYRTGVGEFYGSNSNVFFWTQTLHDCNNNSFQRGLSTNESGVFRNSSNPKYGMYVRCLKLDEDDLVLGCTDINANNYNYVASINDGSCVYDLTYVPDDNFEDYLESHGMGNYTPDDDYVLTQLISSVTDLDISSQSISDLTGIEDFVSLKHLNVSNNLLSEFNLTNNFDLEELYCGSNNLSIINLYNNTELKLLNCDNNSLTELDLSNNVLMHDVSCINNELLSIDISSNSNLTNLLCQSNNIYSLDISTTSVNTLKCQDNQLANLIINTDLVFLNCKNNQITELDVSSNLGLSFLHCDNNQLSYLNVKNGNNINFAIPSGITSVSPFRSDGNFNLTCIEVDDITYSSDNWTYIDSWSFYGGDCSNIVFGCTDVNASNYKSDANADDNCCVYGCDNITSVNYYGVDYEIVEIGDQCWFAENLKTTKYRNGDDISIITDPVDWTNYGLVQNGAAAVYNNWGSLTIENTGYLYNSYAVENPNRLCPTGWHVPTTWEKNDLVNYLNNSANCNSCSSCEALPLKCDDWEYITVNGNVTNNFGGTNSTAFSVKPSGYRRSYDGADIEIISDAYLWCSDPISYYEANSFHVSLNSDVIDNRTSNRRDGLSVRCIQGDQPIGQEVLGCIDPIACNYQNTANSDDGSCDYCTCPINIANGICGCMDSNACNYSQTAVIDDGSCDYSCIGCMDDTSLTYDVQATINDNSLCEYSGCDNLTTINYYGIDYSLVEIQGQCWFAENLKTEYYSNGDLIPLSSSCSAWTDSDNNQEGARSYVGGWNDPGIIDYWGYLYNYYTIEDSRNLCPTGWHVPSETQWLEVFDYYGGVGPGSGAAVNFKVGPYTTPSGNNYDFGGTNFTGFTGMPAGFRGHISSISSDLCTFYYVNDTGIWWSSTPSSSDKGISFYFKASRNYPSMGYYYKGEGFSVRCVKD